SSSAPAWSVIVSLTNLLLRRFLTRAMSRWIMRAAFQNRARMHADGARILTDFSIRFKSLYENPCTAVPCSNKLGARIEYGQVTDSFFVQRLYPRESVFNP